MHMIISLKHAIVEGELLTQRERDTKARYILDFVFESVNIPKNKIYFSFGVRKAMH